MHTSFNRRQFLRGAMYGGIVTVGLPFLECFLDANGQAHANGSPLPTRFGTWFWGLGNNSSIWVPKKIGAGYDLPEELVAIKPVQKYINVFSNFDVVTDGKPNLCHYSGWVALRCGSAPASRTAVPNESIDVTISDAIGGGTRFSSLELAATGIPQDSYSFRSIDAVNPPEVSAVDLYQRLFGPEFRDPNASDFRPDPKAMVRKSVLSAVAEDSASLNRALGSADRARLDQYLTALRSAEQRLALQMQRPAPAEACRIPAAIDKDAPTGTSSEFVAERHKVMTDLLVMALACNQTRVFNMLYSNSFSTMTKTGYPSTHHTITHEEPVNEKLGYQEMNSWFVRRSMEAWAYFVGALASVQEGDGTLLDRTLVFAHSDHEFAKVHSLRGIPMMTAGSAGGRIKTGVHVDGQHEPASRVGLTVLRTMGLPTMEWGAGSMATSKEITEIRV